MLEYWSNGKKVNQPLCITPSLQKLGGDIVDSKS